MIYFLKFKIILCEKHEIYIYKTVQVQSTKYYLHIQVTLTLTITYIFKISLRGKYLWAELVCNEETDGNQLTYLGI